MTVIKMQSKPPFKARLKAMFVKLMEAYARADGEEVIPWQTISGIPVLGIYQPSDVESVPKVPALKSGPMNLMEVQG